MTYPADTPVRERILDNIEAALAAIAPPNFKSTLSAAQVKRWNGNSFALNASAAAVVVPQEELHDDSRIGMVQHTMNLIVVLGVRGVNWAAKLPDLIADARMALTKDQAAWSRGGLALTTRITSDRVFDGSGTEPLAEAHLNVQVLYRTLYDDPTTPK